MKMMVHAEKKHCISVIVQKLCFLLRSCRSDIYDSHLWFQPRCKLRKFPMLPRYFINTDLLCSLSATQIMSRPSTRVRLCGILKSSSLVATLPEIVERVNTKKYYVIISILYYFINVSFICKTA